MYTTVQHTYTYIFACVLFWQLYIYRFHHAAEVDFLDPAFTFGTLLLFNAPIYIYIASTYSVILSMLYI